MQAQTAVASAPSLTGRRVLAALLGVAVVAIAAQIAIPLPGTPVPMTLQPLAINRALSIESVNRALAGDRLVFLALQKSDKDEPEPDDLHAIGTVAAIRQPLAQIFFHGQLRRS